MSEDNPQIQCLPDGPYLLTKNETTKVSLHVTGPDGETVSEVTGVALCRCGASKNKPFCDDSHLHIKFSDEQN
jgi:CDGSH-type Zn-finger protein